MFKVLTFFLFFCFAGQAYAAAAYDICADTSVSGALSSESNLPVRKRLVIANPASNKNQQTFLRFVNPLNESVEVKLYGTDDKGLASRRPPIGFTLGANESKQLTAQDLENGNREKGLESSFCDGAGKWQVTARSSKVIQVMGLIRTPDGFLTGLTDVVPVEKGSNIVYFANPASNGKQQTFLRVVNNSSSAGTVTVTGTDNLGLSSSGAVSFELGANESKQMTAQDLENGNPSKGLSGKLGDGIGKWRLTIASALDLSAQSLIRTPDGFLTNMSAVVKADANGDSTVNFLNSGDNTSQQSFVRLINSNVKKSSVTISVVDDEGQIAPNGDVSVTLRAGQSLEFSASDLEQGNIALGLVGSIGIGSGRWRLNISSEPKIKVMSYVLTASGFLTNMGEVAGAKSTRNEVWVFNPGSNANQASKLRIINGSSLTASVTVSGVDDSGTAEPGSALAFNLSGGSVKEITAAELENGSSQKGLTGGLGDGKGKWRLTVASNVPVTVQSLLETPAGFITNLSSAIPSKADSSPFYASGKLLANSAISAWFDRSLDVYGIRLLVAGEVGGQPAVPAEWAKKTAQAYKLLMDPDAPGIDFSAQERMIKTLLGEIGWHSGRPTGQRIGYGGGASYSPNPLSDEGRVLWDRLEAVSDSMMLDDMVWYKNDTQDSVNVKGDDDINEMMEHVLHTLHRFGVRGGAEGSTEALNMEVEESDVSGTALYLAMREAYDNGVFGIEGYGGDIDNKDAWAVMMKEYQYLLTFGMWEYGQEFWENGSLSPEWIDSARTPEGVKAKNPLGYALFNTYFRPVLSKPSVESLRRIFQDDDKGRSGYEAD
jgi:hypothetical protein